MNPESFAPGRQRRSSRKPQQTPLSLQEEIQAPKLQIAHMEEAIQARREDEVKAYHVLQSPVELKPRRQPPPGKTAMQMIQGQWPGEETTEQLLAQLKALG